jgi:NAD+ diphosphatase
MITLQRYWLIFQKDGSVLVNDSNLLLNEADIAALMPYFIRQFQLGLLQNSEYYCAEIEPEMPISTAFRALPFRHILNMLNDERFGVGVKAQSILNWDRHHQYCGCCGGKTTPQAKMFERVCPVCKLSFFPRISPSIIVLIKKGDHLLMARSPHFPPGVYGLIAGFVDAGENLEAAVHREVKEEVGLEIKNVTYVSSQPWPFPDSLMMAFTADYASGEIQIDGDEIEAAGWYPYDNLPGRPSTRWNIASILIDAFIMDCQTA